MSAAGIAATNASVATDGDLVAAVRLGDDAAFERALPAPLPRASTPSSAGWCATTVAPRM